MKNLFWSNKNVLITGHTGFKGSWLSIGLEYLGANVTGYSLTNDAESSLFKCSRIGEDIHSYFGDILNRERLREIFEESRPEIVFHLAAQSLVTEGYKSPLTTYETNVVGTANVLEFARQSDSVVAVVNVTSDKCYQNFEQSKGYREGDRLGGYDPYSSSKACAELVSSCYQNLYKNNTDHKDIRLASVRAGNVIGGGDWNCDRLIPDIIRHIYENKSLGIRNLGAVRPWQHVIEPLSGYMRVAEKLFNKENLAEAWNFGANREGCSTVLDLIKMINTKSGNRINYDIQNAIVHETTYLYLDNSMAKEQLNWSPKWNLSDTIDNVLTWYEGFYSGQDMRKLTLDQIKEFEKLKI